MLMEGREVQRYQAFAEFTRELFRLPMQIEQYMVGLHGPLHVICPFLSVGRIEMWIDAPSTELVPNGLKQKKLIYNNGIIELTDAYKKEFRTEEGGLSTWIFYPIKGEFFGENEIKWLDMVAEMLFVYGGRARMGGLLTQALRTDMMTGLPNVAEFLEHGNRLIAKHKITQYTAIYYNIKNFKYVNQIVAYRNGNQVMVQYAKKANAFMQGEEMLARLGGDNYIALVHNDRLEAFLTYLGDIWVDVATAAGVKQIPLGFRAGITPITGSVHHIGEIITSCSVALQIAKDEATSDIVYYTDELSKRVMHDKKVQLQFERALENGEFVAFLQPKVYMKTGEICGAEALARWIHEGQIVSPAAFIPVLERDGSICQLDFEILRQTCAYIKKWTDQGKKPVCISVNMSRLHLTDPNFIEDLIQIVDSYQIDHKYIEIELTETASYEEYNVMVDLNTKLKAAGFMTSIDDFGTGYSSLTLLKRLDVDVLKLDRSFLWEINRDETVDEKDRIVIKGVIQMANDLGIHVLAEGVETTKQRDFLVENACSIAQGFLYAKPMQVDEFEKMSFA